MQKTIFCDIDGCILHHGIDYIQNSYNSEPKIIPGSKEKLFDWYCYGHNIILTTGRPEHERLKLEAFFSKNGIFYHQLIMNCGANARYLINDRDPKILTNKAFSINLTRNVGLGNINLDKDGMS
jgi:hypothetical protein